MKNKWIFWISPLLAISLSLPAQVLDQGNFMMGSTIGFSVAESKVILHASSNNEEGEGPSSTQFNISPSVGYFILDHFALGIGMDYTYNAIREPNQDKNDGSNLLFGPFVRYYFPVDEDIAFFAVTNFGFGNSSDNQLVGTSQQSIQSNIFAVGIGPGFSIFSNSAIGLEALFKYNYARSVFDTEIAGVKTTTTTRGSQFDLSLGVQFYFGGIQKVGATAPKPGF
ncbi:MAG TPA: hypothetical protein PKA00_23095 [Saprospiraceae bacterium]|nr:hypothetical protein [Saprospiraceae bacterium]HMQ85815.1 hypothetical protein [Saprospiraceae bacterium]